MRQYLLVCNGTDNYGDMQYTLSVNGETLNWVQKNLVSGKHYRYSRGPERHIIVTDNAMTAIALACSIN